MTSSNRPSAAIVGAGISGLTCARALLDAGFHVEVFEKSRGVGGRLATRRADYGTFDHGAQYFTARHPRFQEAVTGWTARGDVSVWSPRLVALDAALAPPRRTRVSDSTERHVGVASMSRIGRMLAEGLTVHLDCRVANAKPLEAGWHLEVDRGDDAPSTSTSKARSSAVASPFDWLVAAMPSAQAADLLLEAPALRAQALALPMVPCWALLLRFDAPLPLDFDAAFIDNSCLTWMARNSSKPGREPEECWVVHAARDWSEGHIEMGPEAIVAPLLAEFSRVTGVAIAPSAARAHRWRYSGPAAQSQARCLFEPTLKAGSCGDWLAGSRVEGAFLSGTDLAQRIIEADAAA